MPTTDSLTVRTAQRPGGRRPSEDRIFQTDNAVIVLSINNEITESRDDRLANISKSIYRPAGQRDMSKREWVERMSKFESFRNQPGGFWCVSASPEAADEAIVKQLRSTDCEAVMLMTDGVSAIVDAYEAVPNWSHAMGVGREDPERLVTRPLQSGQEARSTMTKPWQ